MDKNINAFIEDELKTFHPTFNQIYDIAEVVKKYAKIKCKEQRQICQTEYDKDSMQDEAGHWYVSCNDVLYSDEPDFN